MKQKRQLRSYLKEYCYTQAQTSTQWKGKHFCEPNIPALDPTALLSDSTATPGDLKQT